MFLAADSDVDALLDGSSAEEDDLPKPTIPADKKKAVLDLKDSKEKEMRLKKEEARKEEVKTRKEDLKERSA